VGSSGVRAILGVRTIIERGKGNRAILGVREAII
jgi:hypothetical protein